MRRTKIIAATVAIMAVLITVLSVITLPTSEAATSQLNENDKITTDVGHTDDLGGGDHFYVKFGSDAAFGILWGTNDTPNDIYFVSYVARTIGYINVDEPNGTVIAQKPVKIYTLYAVELDRLIEYNDSNGNGVLNYTALNDGGYATPMGVGNEQIFKGVDLNTAWTAGNWNNVTNADGSKTWSFTLTATNLSYTYNDRHSINAVPSGDNMLNNISLTFHLTAMTNYVNNITVPQWNVTMSKGMFGNDRFKDLEQTENLTLSGNVTDYHVKWDKSIQGWDADPRDANPTVMAEYRTLVENYIPPTVTGMMALAEYQRMFEATGDNGTMVADGRTCNGNSNLNNAFSLHSHRLTFGGDRSKIGTMEWVQNVTVDGKNMNATAQVTALKMFNVHFGGKNFNGFVASVGISYPYGESIVQDPEISSQAVTETSPYAASDGSGSSMPLHIGLIAIGVGAIVVLACAVILVKRRGKGKGPSDQMDRYQRSQQWEQFNDKK